MQDLTLFNKDSAKAITQDIQVFNCELGSVRVIMDNGEPLFMASDLCQALEYKNGRDTINRLFPKGVAKYYTPTNGGNQLLSYLTEAQMYKLIMRSNAKNAEAFQDWVCGEVLPSIRKMDIGIKDSSKYLPQEVNSNCIKVDVKLFNFEMFDVETLFENSTPYFKLTDIENILGLTKGQSAKWIKEGWFDEDEVKLRNSQLGGYPLKYVAESGLYRILNRTNSPKARPFERWVTKEVLPSIRKNGGYIAGQESMSELEIIANALVVANNVIQQKSKELEAIKALRAKEKPLVDFANQVASASNSISVRDFAKLLNDEKISIGQNNLFKWLRSNGYLMKDNMPYQKYIDSGYFDVIEQTYKTPYGSKVSLKTLVTGKGQIYFTEKLRNRI